MTKEKDSGDPSQTAEFLGTHLGTYLSAFNMTSEQAEKLCSSTVKLLGSFQIAPLPVAKLQGKLFWFGPCLEHVSPMTRALSDFIGAPNPPELYDVPKDVTRDLVSSLLFW
eukprot:3120501-Rhodomonas_salina.3